MGKITSRNNSLLRDVRQKTSPKVYNILINLINEEREDLAEIVLKVDYLIEYSDRAIKAKDFTAAKESIKRAEERIELLKKENKNIEYLEYLIAGVKKKIKK